MTTLRPNDPAPSDVERLRAAYEAHHIVRRLAGTGCLLFGALYATMVFVAAVMAQTMLARDLALLTAGLTWGGYLAQSPPGAPAEIRRLLAGLSVAAGILAGACLVCGV